MRAAGRRSFPRIAVFQPDYLAREVLWQALSKLLILVCLFRRSPWAAMIIALQLECPFHESLINDIGPLEPIAEPIGTAPPNIASPIECPTKSQSHWPTPIVPR